MKVSGTPGRRHHNGAPGKCKSEGPFDNIIVKGLRCCFSFFCGELVETKRAAGFEPQLTTELVTNVAGDQVDVSVVIPCLNEANSIGICVEKAKKAFAEAGLRGEVGAADNGSTDGSTAIAEKLGA